MRTAIPNLIRRVILQRTHCDNSPHNPAIGCKEYICPLWKCNNGMFDESGKEIDHIIEVKFGGTNELKNLQVSISTDIQQVEIKSFGGFCKRLIFILFLLKTNLLNFVFVKLQYLNIKIKNKC